MKRRDIGVGVAIALAWGLNFVAIGSGLHALPPLLFVGLRYLFAGLPIAFFIRAPDVPRSTVIWLGLLGGVGQFGLLFLGVKTGMPAGMSSVVLQAQMPFTVLLSALLLGERPNPLQITGLVVAVAGLIVVASFRQPQVPLTAVLLVAGGGACWAGANVLARSARSARPFSLLIHSSVVASGCMLLLSILFEGPSRDWRALTNLPVEAIFSLSYVVIIATICGYGAWYWLLSKYESSTVSAFPLLAPIAALSSAWFFLHEAVPRGQIVGAAVVVLGVSIAVFNSRASGSKPKTGGRRSKSKVFEEPNQMPRKSM